MFCMSLHWSGRLDLFATSRQHNSASGDITAYVITQLDKVRAGRRRTRNDWEWRARPSAPAAHLRACRSLSVACRPGRGTPPNSQARAGTVLPFARGSC